MSKKKVPLQPRGECPHGIDNPAECGICLGWREDEKELGVDVSKQKVKQKHNFPKILYVVKEQDGSEIYFAAHERIDKIDLSNGKRIVASYTLGSIDKLRVTFTMDPLLNDEK